MFAHVREQIDARTGRLLIFVIGAKRNRQTAPLFHALFQISHQRTPDALPLVQCTYNQGMQFPDTTMLIADSTDPSKDRTILIESYATDPTCLKQHPNFFQRG